MPLALIAHLTFWVAIVLTVVNTGWRRPLGFVCLWLVGYAASTFLPLVGGFLFDSYVALLDVVLLTWLKLDRVP